MKMDPSQLSKLSDDAEMGVLEEILALAQDALGNKMKPQMMALQVEGSPEEEPMMGEEEGMPPMQDKMQDKGSLKELLMKALNEDEENPFA